MIAATLIRVYGALATGHMNEDARLHLVSSAGALAWLAIALFAVLVARARRREPRMKAILFDGAAAAVAQKAGESRLSATGPDVILDTSRLAHRYVRWSSQFQTIVASSICR